MKRITAKGLVLQFLKENGDWRASFEIERLSEISPYMASNLSRRARQLVEEGVAEKKRVGKIECFRCKPAPITYEQFKQAVENEKLFNMPRSLNAQ